MAESSERYLDRIVSAALPALMVGAVLFWMDGGRDERRRGADNSEGLVEFRTQMLSDVDFLKREVVSFKNEVSGLHSSNDEERNQAYNRERRERISEDLEDATRILNEILAEQRRMAMWEPRLAALEQELDD